MSYSNSTVNNANKSDLFPSQEHIVIDPPDDPSFPSLENPVDFTWKPIQLTLLEKYNVSDWDDMKDLVVQQKDAKELLRTAVFVFHNGATIKTNTKKSHGKKQAWMCAGTNCYWQCGWQMMQQTYGKDRRVFVDPYTEASNRLKAFVGTKKSVAPLPIDTWDNITKHSAECITERNNRKLKKIESRGILLNLPCFVRFVLAAGHGGSVEDLRNNMGREGFDISGLSEASLSRSKSDIWDAANEYVKASYNYLPAYLNEICKNNPATVASLQLDSKNRFLQMFFLPGYLKKMIENKCVLEVVQVDFCHSKSFFYDGVY